MGITESSGLTLDELKEAYVESAFWSDEQQARIDSIPRYKLARDLIDFDEQFTRLIRLEEYEHQADQGNQVPSLERAYREIRTQQADFWNSKVAINKVSAALNEYLHNGFDSSGLTLRDLQRAYKETDRWSEEEALNSMSDKTIWILFSILEFDSTLGNLVNVPSEPRDLSQIQRFEREFLRLALSDI